MVDGVSSRSRRKKPTTLRDIGMNHYFLLLKHLSNHKFIKNTFIALSAQSKSSVSIWVAFRAVLGFVINFCFCIFSVYLIAGCKKTPKKLPWLVVFTGDREGLRQLKAVDQDGERETTSSELQASQASSNVGGTVSWVAERENIFVLTTLSRVTTDPEKYLKILNYSNLKP